MKASQIEGWPQPDAETTLAMDAYRRGDYHEALLRLRRMGDVGDEGLEILRAATLGQLGHTQEAQAVARTLYGFRPRVEGSFRNDMERRHFAPPLIASLEAGLTKAGLIVQ